MVMDNLINAKARLVDDRAITHIYKKREVKKMKVEETRVTDDLIKY